MSDFGRPPFDAGFGRPTPPSGQVGPPFQQPYRPPAEYASGSRRDGGTSRPFLITLLFIACVVLGALFCGGMTYFLSNGTWWRLLFWTLLGVAIYVLYGYRHSKLRKR